MMGNIINKLDRCRLCQSFDCKLLFVKNDYEVKKCNRCKHQFLNFKPSVQFLTDYYAKDYFNDPGIKHAFSNYEEESKNLSKTFIKHCNVLRKYHQKGKLLDIGCATGTFMEIAREYFQVYGVEISAYAGKIAKKKGLNVFTGQLEQSSYNKPYFDVVTLWDTIEHLPHPLKTLEKINQITKPKGIVALTTGNVDSLISKASGKSWHLYNVPQHLSYFSPKSITYLFNQCGFEVKEIVHPGVNFSLNYLLFRLITFYRLKFLFSAYSKLSQRKLLNLSFPVNLRDIMLVIAQKRTII